MVLVGSWQKSATRPDQPLATVSVHQMRGFIKCARKSVPFFFLIGGVTTIKLKAIYSVAKRVQLLGAHEKLGAEL